MRRRPTAGKRRRIEQVSLDASREGESLGETHKCAASQKGNRVRQLWWGKSERAKIKADLLDCTSTEESGSESLLLRRVHLLIRLEDLVKELQVVWFDVPNRSTES